MKAEYFFTLVIGSGLVTWLPRITPFIFSRKVEFPKKLTLFLSYLPLCILTALLIQSLLNYREGQFPTLKIPELLACLPAVLVGIRTKDLMKIVVTGIIGIAVLRLFL